MKKISWAAPLFLSAIMAAAWIADAAAQTNPPTTRASNTSGATGSHDPSRMTLCDGKYYVYSTGGGMKWSSDQVTWTSGPSPFAAVTPTTAPSPATNPAPGPAFARGRGGPADGPVIELQPYSASDFQKWIVTMSPEGYYRLSSVGSGKVFEVGAGANQQWMIKLLSDGNTYCLKLRSSQESLGFRAEDVGAAPKPAVAALTTAAWRNLASQKWTFGAP